MILRSLTSSSSHRRLPLLLPNLISKPLKTLATQTTTLSPTPTPLPPPSWVFRNLSYGSVNLVIRDGKPRFETHEVDPPKKEKWKTKKRLKLMRKREKEKRREANRKDPRKLGVKRERKKRFENAEERLLYKLERARIKEAALIERLKRYEVQKLQGPEVKPCPVTGEERFYLKKMAQKGTNYVPVGRRGVFGGVILNMHMHWKKHETVKVFFKQCKPGQLQEYADEIARLSGGIPIQTIGNDTIIFYRGKNYVQPEPHVMSPIDTLSKKRALEKSKCEQSLETVRHFIAVSEMELELYRRHVALYSDPNKRKSEDEIDHSRKQKTTGSNNSVAGDSSFLPKEYGSTDDELSDSGYGSTDEELSGSGSDLECCDFDEDGEFISGFGDEYW